jgi:uncharacterized protein with HEPN domain
MGARRVPKYLHDILDAGDSVVRLSADMSFEEYRANEAVRLAVERQFITMGEPLTQLDAQDPNTAAQVEHAREVIGFRNTKRDEVANVMGLVPNCHQ